ncbi:MAG TPA: pyruvate kinase [Chlamydiales bacterium]|mgnify:CR=1 FL=1|nr:pyruvate kinase [Chlamydiales bacterium]
MKRQTKIICTIGPAIDSYDAILQMIDKGMNVARINFSHSDHEHHRRVISDLKRARKERNKPLAILLDTKGPEIRVGVLSQGTIELKSGERFSLVDKLTGKNNEIPINPFNALKNVSVGNRILFDDGYIITETVEVLKDRIIVEVKNSGILKSRKGVNVPGVSICLPPMTDQDREDLLFGLEEEIDMVAASFIRSKSHVEEIKEFLKEHGKENIPVFSKIENSEGVENFDEILEASDGIMVARGDLGVEVDISSVPALQKKMIKKCYMAFKPVIIATQMLESMIEHPRPTRAEVSDVANAIYDSTALVMLSGETAMGKYPFAALSQMVDVIENTEKDFDFDSFFHKRSHIRCLDTSTAVAIAAVNTAYNMEAKALFAFTSSGFTARLVASLRPKIPLIALTTDLQVYHQLAFIWGVIPVYVESCQSSEEALEIMKSFALTNQVLQKDDLVVVTAGSPFGKKGSTNMIIVEHV